MVGGRCLTRGNFNVTAFFSGRQTGTLVDNVWRNPDVTPQKCHLGFGEFRPISTCNTCPQCPPNRGVHVSMPPKWHLDQFTRFCRAHPCAQHIQAHKSWNMQHQSTQMWDKKQVFFRTLKNLRWQKNHHHFNTTTGIRQLC